MSVEAIYRGGRTFPPPSISGSTAHVDGVLYQFPEPTTGIKCNFIPVSKLPLPIADGDDERAGYIEFNIDGAIAKVPVRLYIQGRSSAAANVPEKNWNMKFYKTLDDAVNDTDERAWVKIGQRNEMDKLIFKAWWIEATKSHPYIGFTIWDQMTKARQGYPKYEVDNWILNQSSMPDNLFTGATGSCSVWAATFFVDNEFYGIGDVISTKDYYNYNLPKNPDDPNLLLWRGHTASIKTTDSMDQSHDFEAQVPKEKNWNQERVDKVNKLTSLILGDDGEFKANVDGYYDQTNLIDYFLFSQFTSHIGAFAETMLLTYTGNTWYFLPWDIDMCFGSGWTNSMSEVRAGDDRTLLLTTTSTPNRKTLAKVNRVFKTEMGVRYAELRRLGVFSIENVMDLMKYHESMYSRLAREQDMVKWGNTNGGYKTSFGTEGAEKLLAWMHLRVDMLDEYYEFTD